MCIGRKKKGKSTVLSGGLCLRDSEAEQRASQFLHIYCSHVKSYSSAPELNKQNPQDRTIDLPFFFRYKHITFLKCVSWPALSDSLLYSLLVSWQLCGHVCLELLVERIHFVCSH